MRSFIKAYTSFTRTERMGISALLILLGLLITIRVTMHLWVKPDIDVAKQQKLEAAWAAFKAEQQQQTVIDASEREQTIAAANEPAAGRQASPSTRPNSGRRGETVKTVLFPFDPNTIDSAGLRQLGLKEKTTSILLHWRAKGKVFYKKEELKRVYTLTEEEYNRLEPYILIKPPVKQGKDN